MYVFFGVSFSWTREGFVGVDESSPIKVSSGGPFLKVAAKLSFLVGTHLSDPSEDLTCLWTAKKPEA